MTTADLIVDEPLIVPADARTLNGFRAWVGSDAFPSKYRIAYLQGEIYIEMSPEEINIHNRLKTEMTYRIRQLVEASSLGEVFSDRALLTNADADLSTEPDAMFAFWDTLRSNKLRLVPREGYPAEIKEVEGTPDWVLEIVSRTSQRKDKQVLRKAYHSAGIAEYWLIDAVRDPVRFHMLRRRPGGYEEVAVVAGWLRSPLFHREFKLQRARDPLGNWRYTLAVKPL